tara:strand:- start:1323 stop:2138 length:816 start_codon:yes stop_codon:yes gene_type:complete
MLSTKTKTVSIVCNTSNKTPDGRYQIAMGALAGESVIGATLKSCVFRNLFYNVVSDGALKNNTFHFTLDGAAQVFEIPEGFYNITQILPLIQSGIQTILNLRIAPVQTVILTYASLTGKVTITVTDNGNNDNFELSGGTFKNSTNFLLGNTENTPIDSLTPTPKQMENIIELSGEDACQLIIEEVAKGSGLNNSSVSSFGATSGLIKLLSFQNCGFGEMCNYQNNDLLGSMLYYSSPQNLSRLTIYLSTAEGTILNQQAADMHIELLLHLL